jgi:hypothetical protein
MEIVVKMLEVLLAIIFLAPVVVFCIVVYNAPPRGGKWHPWRAIKEAVKALFESLAYLLYYIWAMVTLFAAFLLCPPFLLLVLGNNLNTPPAGGDEFAWPWEKRNALGEVIEKTRLTSRIKQLFKSIFLTSSKKSFS